jgi:hypothetical protein
MKIVPGEGRDQAIRDEAVKLLEKLALVCSDTTTQPGTSFTLLPLPQSQHLDLPPVNTETLTRLENSAPLSFPDFQYLNIFPGDTEPSIPPPAYSEADSLLVDTGPVEQTSADPSSLECPPYSPSYSPPLSISAFPIYAPPDITIYPPSTPSPSAAAPPINSLSFSPMSSLSLPPIPPSSSEMPPVPSKKTKGKKGKKGKKKEKAERKAKMAATAINPAGPSSDEGFGQPQTPSSTSTVIYTPVTGEFSSSPSAPQTPLAFEVCNDPHAYLTYHLY